MSDFTESILDRDNYKLDSIVFLGYLEFSFKGNNVGQM